MKYPFLMIFIAILVGTLVLMMLASAMLVELKCWADRKRGVGR